MEREDTMATVHNPEIVKTLMRNKGEEDGFTFRLIYQYQGMNDETLFALFTEPAYCDIHQSPYVRNPVLLMQDGRTTPEGKAFLAG